MARYKHIDTSPKFLPVDLTRQLLPGTFEHALNHLLDHEVDWSGFDARYCNDETGASAYPPAMLLKVILFAYAQGIVSSRDIEQACREHVTFIALCGDRAPHFTTLAGFIGKRVCGPCPLRDLCLRHPDRTPVRQVVFFTGKNHAPESHSARMKRKIDSAEGRRRYGGRFATVEPVFGNLRYNKGLDRFTLRGKTKVDAQWKLFCLVHNIEKLAHHGYAQ
jgi:hypothetical protein